MSKNTNKNLACSIFFQFLFYFYSILFLQLNVGEIPLILQVEKL